MKSLRAIVIFGIATSISAHAGTVAMSNGGTVAELTAIANFDSTLASGGIAAAGYFATLTDAQVFALSADLGNITQLYTDFQIVGSTTLDSAIAGAGVYSGDFSSVSLPNTTLAGNQLYSFLGNAATLATSTEWLLWLHTDEIDAQDTIAQPDSNSLVLGQEGSALISGGTFASAIDFDGPGGDEPVAVNAIRLAGTAVPEPSALLLSALGVLALLRRKR